MQQLFTHTPIWVWGILVLLVYLGVVQSRQREVNSTRLLITPVAMTGLSMYSVWATFGLTALSVGGWLGGLVMAQLGSLALQGPPSATYLKQQDRILVPGSWAPLGLMMAIFLTKYFVAASLATHFLEVDSTPLVTGCSALLGLFSGVFIARARKTLQCKKAGS